MWGAAIVTRGASGAVAATASVRVAASAVVVPVVDTIGAGDSFQAALLTWLAEDGALAIDAISRIGDDRLANALRFACSAASLTCARRGADLPTRPALSAAMAAVDV